MEGIGRARVMRGNRPEPIMQIMFTSIFSFRPGRWALLASAGLAAWAPQLQAQDTSQAAQIASMSEDIQMLSQEVKQLSLEVDTLSQNNAALQKQIIGQKDVETMVQNAIAESHGDTRNDITQANSELRKEIVDEVSKQIDALTKDTNRQLAALAKAMQTTPPAPATTIPATGATPALSSNTTAPVAFSDDYPRTGIEYVIQSGDTLGKIARKHGSTVRDIENANHISDPAGLQVGRTIFIPQKTPEPATPAGNTTATATPVAVQPAAAN
jgi:LysM repeat protein